MPPFKNSYEDGQFQQYFIVHDSPISYFSRIKSDHFKISLRMTQFKNFFGIDQCPTPFFSTSKWDHFRIFSQSWISTKVHHWPNSDIPFSSIKWDHFRICLRIKNVNNISSLTNVRCNFLLTHMSSFKNLSEYDEFHQCIMIALTSNVLHRCIKLRSF